MADRGRQLSRYFRLGDFLVDASFRDLAAELEPVDEHIRNLERLAAVIDQIVDRFGGEWTVLTGYRNQRLNDACRNAGMPASLTSLHLDGCAADLKPDPTVDLEAVYDWVSRQARGALPIHEVVYYPKKGFIHVAVQSVQRPSAKRILIRT